MTQAELDFYIRVPHLLHQIVEQNDKLLELFSSKSGSKSEYKSANDSINVLNELNVRDLDNQIDYSHFIFNEKDHRLIDHMDYNNSMAEAVIIIDTKFHQSLDRKTAIKVLQDAVITLMCSPSVK